MGPSINGCVKRLLPGVQIVRLLARGWNQRGAGISPFSGLLPEDRSGWWRRYRVVPRVEQRTVGSRWLYRVDHYSSRYP